MSRTQHFLIYLFFFYLFGLLEFLLVFGAKETLQMLNVSPFSKGISAVVILLSAFLAALLIFIWKEKKLTKWLFSYLTLGFHTGNLALVFMFYQWFFLAENIQWLSWEGLKALFMPFVLLLLSYIAGFAFLSLVPAITSACVLWLIVEKWKCGSSRKRPQNPMDI